VGALKRFATVWLGGCSGCHMSFLDLDEFLLELVKHVEIVYSPVVDTKVFPNDVDIVLVEGAIANDEHLAMIQRVRERSTTLVSFGDCAVTGNVTAMRNPLGSAYPVLSRSYLENGDLGASIPSAAGVLPVLVDRVRPVHAVVKVDVYIPGCPPPAARIRSVLEQLLAGENPQLLGREIKFG
jgi:NAD-reducing hydrogenase small subunit